MNDDAKLVEVDSRGRLSLMRHIDAEKRYQFYFVEVFEDGSISLTPAVAVPASQAKDRDHE